MSRPTLLALVAASSFFVPGCKFFLGPGAGSAKPAAQRPVVIHSYSETRAATSVLPIGRSALWVGTSRGLLRWDVEKQTAKLLTTADGLPSDTIFALAPDGQGGVWVATKLGLAREGKKGWEKAPTPPLAAFITGLVQTSDGLWLGGPDGLARLQKAQWSRFLGQTSVTALAAADKELWVGTGGRGIVRLAGENVEVYGVDQGCEAEVVRGLVATPSGVMAIGEGPGGQRLAFFDGARFWSYQVELPGGAVMEWIRRVGDHVLIGVGQSIYTIERLASDQPVAPGDLRVVAVGGKRLKLPLTGSARKELPEAAAEPAASTAPATAPAAAPSATTAPATTTPAPAAAAPAKDAATQQKDAAPQKPAPAPAKSEPPPVEEATAPAPGWRVSRFGPQLPEGVTCAAADGPVLAVGTRFLGAALVDEKSVLPLRTYDLAADAERLSVACISDNDCYVATGSERAYRYDGQSFGTTTVDPEAGARVLAVLNAPRSTAIAIHRGSDRFLRLSSVSPDGAWTPVGVTQLEVPSGVPGITFARYAPSGHLWLGLRYLDKDGDAVDFGAAEVDQDRGDITYHRRGIKDPTGRARQLPTDLEAVHFVGPGETWFGSRSGAVRLKDGEVKVYTENDGLESEIIHGVVEGTDGQIWVATSRGVGKFDGSRWTFPVEGERLRVKASALARDPLGAVFIGTIAPTAAGTGLLVVSGEQVEQYDVEKGLLDNKVIDLAVDRRGRVWVLTEKGISVVEREGMAKARPATTGAKK